MNILQDYDRDFSKHVPARTLERVRLVWSSIPSHLSKEQKKLVFGAVRPGARAKDLEEAVQWLVDYGTVQKVPQVSAFRVPLKAYASFSAFKLFLLDVGLLTAMSRVDASAILEGSALFTEHKGALTEQYVMQQLVAQGIETFYWSAVSSPNEIDFLIDWEDTVVPIEVKAAENLKSKSLKSVFEKNRLPISVRTSLSNYRDEGWLINVPLWAIGSLSDIIASTSH
jgi:predicted AAA+ superfamily ATPase